MRLVYQAYDGQVFQTSQECESYESRPRPHYLAEMSRLKRVTLPEAHREYMAARSAYHQAKSSGSPPDVVARAADLLNRVRDYYDTCKAMYWHYRQFLRDWRSLRASDSYHRDWAWQEIRHALASDGSVYSRLVMESAFRAYCSLLGDGHSGYSWDATAIILNRMLHRLPLTPITDKDEWLESKTFGKDCGYRLYSTSRMPGIYKTVFSDGSVVYRDNNRAVGINADNLLSYSSGLVSNMADEYLPITLPYYPSSIKVKVFTRTHLDKGFPGDNSDFNRTVVLYIVTPAGENIGVYRTFVTSKHGDVVEISGDELDDRLLHTRKD